MRFRHIFASLALVGAILPMIAFAQSASMKQRGTLAREVATEAKTGPQPLITNQKSFVIPVSVDRASAGHTPVEVQLLVTADQGKNWSTYARQGIDTKGFPFQTRDDGEYWFASRTLDKQGNVRPAGVIVPELRLVIDATPPRIELDAAAGGAGDVKAAWRVTDDTLDPVSIQIEYQASDVLQLNWQKVNLSSDQLKTTGNLVTGEASFTPGSNHRAVDVRLIARDKAGNAHSEVRRVVLPRVAKASPLVPDWPPRVATKPKEDRPNYSNDPFTARMPSTPAVAPPAIAASPTAPTMPTADTWPADNAIASAKPPVDPLAKAPLERAMGDVAPRVREGVLAQPTSNGAKGPLIWPSDAAAQSNSAPPEQTPPYEIVPKGAPAEARFPAEPTDNRTHEMGSINTSKLPAEVKPLLSSSKSFALDYDLDSVGPAGVKAVELWVTTDDGNSWRRWGEDADKKSPFEIQVESERMFGFRMVIVSNNGLATRPPEPGDAADVWVQVDTTKPTVRIVQAGYGQGEHAGQLDIRWQADDEHLGSRPVTFVFSDSPEGPFTTLAAGLPNTGQYYWTIDPRTPRQLYLRLEVRDEAGNLGVDQTTEPISLEGLAPRGRIRSVAPSTPSDIRGAFRTPLFR